MKQTVLITGAAGYIGAMLVDKFARRDDVERIIGIDKEPIPDFIKNEKKLVYIQMNTADDWEEEAREYNPTVVVHCAWQIREMYGDKKKEWEWNIDGSDKVFKFAFTEKSAERLIYFSTASSYGAFESNSTEHLYTEDEPFRKTNYLYAEEKRIAEEHLKDLYEKSDKRVSTTIVRPAAITGPRGRFIRIRFGLQSALSGQLKGALVYKLIKPLVILVPVTPKWLRQFIHEDDVAGIVDRISFGNKVEGFEVFNICPPNSIVLGEDMAKAMGKHLLPIYPWMVRLAFFWTWHLTRGRIPTSPGSWKGYSYPIAIDGSKITRKLGYVYKHAGLDAFQYTDGDYESYVPVEQRRHK